MSLRQLIAFAFQLPADGAETLVVGGPSGLLSQRFDITAVPAPDVDINAADHPRMLRAVLEARFALRTRLEQRPMPVYLLEVASKGRLGPRLRPSVHNCAAWAKASGGNLENEPLDDRQRPLCIRGTWVRAANGDVTRRQAGGIDTLVSWARTFLQDRPVIDGTGLTGNYEWEVTFAPDAPDRLSIFTAYRDDLGLTLTPKSVSRDVVVIDAVQPPPEN